jgi:hypothetical protein
MDKKWIWLILFGVVAVLGAYMTFSGGTTPPAPMDESESPQLGGGSPTIQPLVPGARKEGGYPDAQSPNVGAAPPPGYSATPPNLETFAPPEGQANPNNAFDPVPPQAFENPDFVTPPPPPTQFDSEPVPFDDEVQGSPPQGFDANGIPQPPPDEYNQQQQQPQGSPEGF